MIIEYAVRQNIIANMKALLDYKVKEFQMILDYDDDLMLQLIWATEMAIEAKLTRVIILN